MMGQAEERRVVQPFSLLQRLGRAALFERDLYRDVAANPGATREAFFIVGLAAVATGVGSLNDGWQAALRMGIIVGLSGWFLWTGLALLIGSKLLATPDTTATWIMMARALGFAQAPGLLRFLGVVPVTGWLISLIALVWVFMAMTVALREVLRYDSLWRAAAVIAIGLIPYLLIQVGLIVLTGGP